MQFKFKPDSDTVIISIDEPTLHDAQTKDLTEKIDYFIQQGKKNFIIDLKDMNYLDSRAVGTFVMCRIKILRERGDLVLANVPEQIMSLMGIAHLLPVFTITSTVEEAVEKLKVQREKL